MQAPPEKYAFVAALNPPGSKLNDALLVVDVDPESRTYGQRVGEVKMPEFGDELHHFGWNACSSALCPYAPHPHVERRYLVVPGIRSSRIHIIDTKPDPRKPKIVKVIEPEEVFARANYSRPHTIHCGPEGIYVSALGAPNGDGPGGIFMLDCETFEILGQWEMDRGPQFLHYDFWWHLGFDTLLTSEWGTPNMIESGAPTRPSARRQIRASNARLGLAPPSPFAGSRFGQRATNGSRDASRPQPHQSIRLCRGCRFDLRICPHPSGFGTATTARGV